MIILDKKQVAGLHEKLLGRTGGLHGIRDENLLESALSNPFQTFDGAELYPSTVAKIARTAYGLIRNHPFIDGNKRTGTYVMLVLLELNHIEADFSDGDLVRIGLGLANGSMDGTGLLGLILERAK
jgi:death-on-curing protein